MFLIKLIRRLYKGLAASDSPGQIALGIGLGCILGLIPFKCGLAIVLLAVVLMVKVSFPFAVVAWSLTEILRVSVLSQGLSRFGYLLLEELPLQGLWKAVINWPVVKLMGLERYAVMGGAAAGLCLAVALYFPVCLLVTKYREKVVDKLSQSKAFKRLTNIWLFRMLKWIFIGSSPA